jgi:hypothetical protein
MTSAAEMHQDPDDHAAISPELALVDPELARRLREREPATVVDETPPSPLLRLVPEQELLVEELEPEAEPVVPVRAEAATDDLFVPRPADVESPDGPDRTEHPLAAIALRRQTMVIEPPQLDHLGTDVAAERVYHSSDRIPAAEHTLVAAPVVARPARRPRRWRRRVLSVVLAAVLATGITVGVLAAMGESPVSAADVPGWPTAQESPNGDSTPTQPSTEAR